MSEEDPLEEEPPLTPRSSRSSLMVTMMSDAASSSPFHELEEKCHAPQEMNLEHEEDDVLWSMWSNSFFVSGGACYVVGASWDWYQPPSDASAAWVWILYNSLWTLGPLVYLCNSVIDVLWAWRVQLREKEQRRLQEATSNKSNSNNNTKKQRKKRRLPRIKPKKLLRRIRKHVGHRRDLSAAMSFGVAAACGLVASFQPYMAISEGTASRFEALSVHCYLVSAFFALWGRRTKPVAGTNWFEGVFSNADRLEDLGDAFFGIGSIVDVILCDLHFDDNVGYWPLISALLWLADAFFYLRSDFITMYSQDARYKEFDTGDFTEDDGSTVVDDVSEASTTIAENPPVPGMYAENP